MMKKTLMLNDTSIHLLKRQVALRLPEISPTHRVEFVARGLGYQTYASLLSALSNGPILIQHIDLDCAVAFAERFEVNVDVDDVREILYSLFDLDMVG